MADEKPLLRAWGNVDVQIGGPGNNWVYLSACAGMTGPEVPGGDFESRWCQDPNKAGGFKRTSKIRTEPDLITFDLTTKLNKINHLKRLNCSYGQRARFTECGEREDPSNYDPLMLGYCNVGINSKSYEDLVVTNPGDNDEIMITASATADDEYIVQKMAAGRVGSLATLGDQAINDIDYCDSPSCAGYCGDASDGCAVVFGVTDLDVAPYGWPGLIKGVKNLNTQAFTLTNTPIIGVNGNVENIECSGKRIGVTSNSASVFAYNDDPDQDQDEWNIIALTRAPSTKHNALFTRTAREWWLGCVGGYILKSVDGGQNWSEVHSATITTENFNAVYAYDAQLVVAAGNAGVMIKSTDGGQTWQDITNTATVGSSILNDIVIPPGRPKEIYVATSNGRIYRSTNLGDTWTRIAFDGDSVGTVDDIDFCGPCMGEVMFILHNDAGPRGRILRDLSGGAGGADVEIVMEVTQVFSAGVQLNALACCDVNEAIAAGELSGGYPALVRMS
jgi:hypothetical protein